MQKLWHVQGGVDFMVKSLPPPVMQQPGRFSGGHAIRGFPNAFWHQPGAYGR